MRTTRLSRRAFFVAMFAVTPGIAVGSTAEADRCRTGEPALLIDVSQLRSAYLHRAGLVHYDPGDATPQGLRRQLQHHFDVVLRILIASTPTSIETALVRLERDRGECWSGQEREHWRQRLLRSRLEQLVRLKAYRDCGVFPLNEGHSDDPVPIFVDGHDTACAVGHLMRLSGWDDQVQEIQAANNLVYVPDVERGSLVEWTLESGLTQEEAALIQPMYGGPGGPGGLSPGLGFTYPVSTSDPYDAGEFEPGEHIFEHDGLRFANFQVETLHQGSDPDRQLTTVERLGLLPGTDHPAPQNSFLSGRQLPLGTHWLAIGVPGDGVRPISGYAPYDATQRIIVRFDVSTIDPDARIDQIAQTSSILLRGLYGTHSDNVRSDFDGRLSEYSMSTRVLTESGEAATVYFDQTDRAPSSFAPLQDSAGFGAARQLTIETEILLKDGAGLSSYLLDFNVVSVPEPSTLSLLVLLASGVGAMVICRRTR